MLYAIVSSTRRAKTKAATESSKGPFFISWLKTLKKKKRTKDSYWY